MKKAAKYLLCAGILAAIAIPAFAETRWISWDSVTTYTDGTQIEAGITVNYMAYWTTDPGLGSLRTIGASLATTSTTFDPGVQGMTRGGTVYFTTKAFLNTGDVSSLSPAYAWVVPPDTPTAPGLSSVTVSGPSSVSERGAATYTATGTWDNGSTTSVTPTWSVSSSYATISTGGVLTAAAVTTNQAVSVTASFGGKSGMKSVTIVDVPGTPLAAPKNVGVSGPISSGTTEIWRISWDQVTLYANDAPIEAGRTVRYTPYWTDDPALTAGSLRQLASSVSGTTLEFDPSAKQMAKNQVVYFTVLAVLDSGDSSSLAASVSWRVSNSGPVPPGLGRILKK